MAILRVPSVQHLSRNWKNDPSAIARALVRLVQNPPTFNYNPLYGALRDYLILHVPYDDVIAGIKRIKRVAVRENLLSVMPLIREYFDGIVPDFYQLVDKRYYPVGRGLMVPFEPPMIYGVGGQLYFPWFSFWRRNPLSDERLSLFVTLVDEILLQDPDLEHARFEILDFSSPSAKSPRALRVIDARDIARLTNERKRQMLENFADGYFQALAILGGQDKEGAPPDHPDTPPPPNPSQPDLFGR